MSDQWAVTLALYSHKRTNGLVVFDSIETGCSLTMSIEAYQHAGEPATVVVLVPDDALTRAGKLSYDAEPVSNTDTKGSE